jgi:hypothetical protein
MEIDFRLDIRVHSPFRKRQMKEPPHPVESAHDPSVRALLLRTFDT